MNDYIGVGVHEGPRLLKLVLSICHIHCSKVSHETAS